MSEKLIECIKPTDIDISNYIMNTFGKCEKEIVARNIIVMSVKLGGWKPFTWEEYKNHCTHIPTYLEKEILDELVKDKVLSLHNEKYLITNRFIGKLADYIK